MSSRDEADMKSRDKKSRDRRGKEKMSDTEMKAKTAKTDKVSRAEGKLTEEVERT